VGAQHGLLGRYQRPGQRDDYELKPDLLDVALAIAEAVPDDETRLRAGAAFAPRVAVPDNVTGLGRIVALLGRRPDWRPPS
jgi:hypothetical protein